MALFHNPNELRHDDTNVRDAVRFCLAIAVLSAAFLVFAALWVSTCQGATVDAMACGAPQRTLLAIGAPAILLLGGLFAFVRTYRIRRSGEASWPWQGAGCILVTLTLVVVALSMPAVAGPAVFGA